MQHTHTHPHMHTRTSLGHFILLINIPTFHPPITLSSRLSTPRPLFLSQLRLSSAHLCLSTTIAARFVLSSLLLDHNITAVDLSYSL